MRTTTVLIAFILLLSAVDAEEFPDSMTFMDIARAYLENAGMTDEEIDALIQYLTTGEAVGTGGN